MNAAMAAPSRDLPIRDQLLTTLAALGTLTGHLFTHISSPNPPPSLPSLGAIRTDLDGLDSHLSALLALQAEHAAKNEEMERLVEQVRSQEARWRECVGELHEMEQRLGRICRQGKRDEEEMQAVKRGECQWLFPRILSYARLVSPYSSAPPFGPLASARPAGDGPLDVKDGPKPARAAMPDPMRDPSLRALMPFPSEEVVHRGRMGNIVALTDEQRQEQQQRAMGPEIGETRTAAATRPVQAPPTAMRPTMETDDEVFDLDLNPDL